MGIGKRELMEDYYADEIGPVMAAWNALHNPAGADKVEQVDALTFLGGDGEWLE